MKTMSREDKLKRDFRREKCGIYITMMGIAFILVVGTSGCSKTQDAPNITIDAIVEANTGEQLYAKYGNLVVIHEIDGPYNDIVRYMSKDLYYEDREDDIFLTDGEDNWGYPEIDGERKLVHYWYATDDAEKKEKLAVPTDYPTPVIDPVYTSMEKIETVKNNGDGTFTVSTVLKADDINKIEGADSYSTDQRSEYVIDGETFEIRSCSYGQTDEYGDTYAVSYTVTPGGEQPERMRDMLALIDEYKNGEKKEARNIKIIYDYGTADEETYETVVDRKFLLSPVLKDGYDEVYSDPERKEPYEGGDGVHDCTIYAFKGE